MYFLRRILGRKRMSKYWTNFIPFFPPFPDFVPTSHAFPWVKETSCLQSGFWCQKKSHAKPIFCTIFYRFSCTKSTTSHPWNCFWKIRKMEPIQNQEMVVRNSEIGGEWRNRIPSLGQLISTSNLYTWFLKSNSLLSAKGEKTIWIGKFAFALIEKIYPVLDLSFD